MENLEFTLNKSRGGIFVPQYEGFREDPKGTELLLPNSIALQRYTPSIKQRAVRVLTLLLGMTGGLLGPYSAKAQTPVLDDYLTTKTTDVYHVSVDKDPKTTDTLTGQLAHWDGGNDNQKNIPNFTRLIDALNHDYTTSTPLTVRLHIMPGEWNNEDNPIDSLSIPSNRQLVGQSDSVIKSDFGAYTKGIDIPTTGTFIRNKTRTVPDTSNVSLVNLIFNPNIGTAECVEIDGSTTNTLFNNFVAGRYNSIRSNCGLTIGQNTKARLNNNLFVRFYRQDTDLGAAISVRGEAELHNNIIAESKYGMDILDTAKIDLGTVDIPGNNVFIGNLTKNIQANIGDVDKIPAQLNTWYDVGKINLTSIRLAEIPSYGDPLIDEQSIKDTILILNPVSGGIRLEDSVLQAVKEVVVRPWKLGDSRFGYRQINAVRAFNLYE